MAKVSIAEIEGARQTISGAIRQTPLVSSGSLGKLAGVPVWLKLEHLQLTGSFKLRGATNAVLNLADKDRAKGIVGVSTGNHGRGLARAAREADVKCIICMSELVPGNKIDGIRAEGAEVRIHGRSQDEAESEANRLVSEEGMVMLPPFDHPHIIAGQGTLGLEIEDQLPGIETAVIQLSGGGLICGVAAALKAGNPHIRIVGVSMERGAAMHECLKAGKPVEVEELPTLADSLGGGIGLENRYTFNMVQDLVDEIILVSEQEISAAIRHVYWNEGQVVEGGGSVAVAAVLSGKLKPEGNTVLLLSGGNIDMKLHHRIVSGEDVDVAKDMK